MRTAQWIITNWKHLHNSINPTQAKEQNSASTSTLQTYHTTEDTEQDKEEQEMAKKSTAEKDEL